jgi:hypothetical protein
VLDTLESFQLGKIPQNFKLWDNDPKYVGKVLDHILQRAIMNFTPGLQG